MLTVKAVYGGSVTRTTAAAFPSQPEHSL